MNKAALKTASFAYFGCGRFTGYGFFGMENMSGAQ